MPKPDKNDASNGLILGHEVLQKCSNFFFHINFGHGLDPKIELGVGSIPTYHRRFPEEPGPSEQQPKSGTTCLLIQYGSELRTGHI